MSASGGPRCPPLRPEWAQSRHSTKVRYGRMISEGGSPEAVKPGAGCEPLDLSAFGQGERVFDIDPEVTDRAFDLGMSEQDLYGAQIAR
jgi:hypothetical protein